MKLYFRDNFFNSGETEIEDAGHRSAGKLDLKSAFGSSLDVYREDGAPAASGKFRTLSNKWEVTGAGGEALGVLRSRMTFLAKKYTYETYGRGVFDITSPAFSKEYEVHDVTERRVARFERVSGWFQSGAFCLENLSDKLDSYELIAVIMGVHAIQKRHQSAANSSTM